MSQEHHDQIMKLISYVLVNLFFQSDKKNIVENFHLFGYNYVTSVFFFFHTFAITFQEFHIYSSGCRMTQHLGVLSVL